MTILELFCSVDAFWQWFEPQWERELLASGTRRRRRATRLHPSEILTILILFQQSGYRTFKGLYTQQVQVHLRQEFPHSPKLSTLCGPHAALPRAAGHLSAYATGRVFGDQFYRLDVAQRLPSYPHPTAPCLCCRRAAGQDLGGMVLRLQTPSGRQLPWRVVGLLPDSRQYRRPQARSSLGPTALWTSLRGQRLHSRSPSPSSSWSPRGCALSPNCARTCAISFRPWQIACFCANARSSRPSLTNSRMSAR